MKELFNSVVTLWKLLHCVIKPFFTVFLIDWAYLVLYASCCQIFSFEWLLDAFLWRSSISQLTFQLSFYIDYQNLGNISLKSLCRSKITFIILFLYNYLSLLNSLCAYDPKLLRRYLMLCVVVHSSISVSGVACGISNVIFTSRLLVKVLNDYRQAMEDWCFFLWKLSFGL